MNYEYLFLFCLFINVILLSWNLSLLDSRAFWRKKWEKELEKNDEDKD